MGSAYDEVMKSRKGIMDRMLELIQSGELNWERGYQAAMLSPHNPVSNCIYRGGNRLRLMIDALANGYEDSRYVTYVQAKQKGWQVKRGEKGKLCEKYIFTRQKEEVNEETGEKEMKTVILERPIIHFFYVFNACQIEGIPENENMMVNTDRSHEDVLEKLLLASPCPVYEKIQGSAYYMPSKDCIVLPPRSMFYSNDDFIKTLAHEETHATGAKGRLNRNLEGGFGSESYAREELRAELGSVFLLSDLGLPGKGKVMENHAAYLQSWLGELKNDPNELFHAAADAEKAVDLIRTRYENARTDLENVSEKEETKRTEIML